MAPATKNTANTPGRRKRSDNQYFEVGKVGRKTGITLKDTGIRDEHGLEPVSGIFSSPNEASADQLADKTLTSEGMELDDTSAPDVAQTLSQRRVPRLPPARQSPMKHTRIGGSPRRSSVKRALNAQEEEEEEEEEEEDSPDALPANRRLNFQEQSPFKPKKVLRRSMSARPDPFSLEDDETAKTSIEHTNGVMDDDDNVEQSIAGDEGPIMIDDGDSYPLEPEETAADVEATEVLEPPPKRKPGRPRKSEQSVDSSRIRQTPPVDEAGSRRKRTRTSLEESEVQAESGAAGVRSATGPPGKRIRRSGDKAIIHGEHGDEAVEPSEVAFGDQYMIDGDSHIPPQDTQADLDSQLQAQDASQTAKATKRKRGRLAKGERKERDPNQGAPVTATGSPMKLNDSPSKRYKRGGSLGPVSNVNLRAYTPALDAYKVTRAGRACIEPLKFWENESRIWKNGEIEGIVRAEHVEPPKSRRGSKRKGRKRGSRLDSIEEESDTESLMPDEWEETIGVITGNVANWNPTLKPPAGDPDDPVQEDIAFAASSIITRDVAGSEFKYAKIMTLPFFGAGVVELPPEGYKRAKNSRKMQMVFFIHEGKVMVEVGATGMEVNQFALSKGGVWVVPRGNNYAITNESRTRAAKIFFAQGCMVDQSAE